MRVPLIIAVPGVPPQWCRARSELVDLAPTVLGAAGHPRAGAHARQRPGPWLASPPAPDRPAGPRLRRAGRDSAWWPRRATSSSATWPRASAPTTTWAPTPASAATWPRPTRSGGGAAGRARRLAGLAHRVRGRLRRGRRRRPRRRPSNERGWATRGRRRPLAALIADERLTAGAAPGGGAPAGHHAAATAGDGRALRAARTAGDLELRGWAAVAGARLGDAAVRPALREVVAGGAGAGDAAPGRMPACCWPRQGHGGGSGADRRAVRLHRRGAVPAGGRGPGSTGRSPGHPAAARPPGLGDDPQRRGRRSGRAGRPGGGGDPGRTPGQRRIRPRPGRGRPGAGPHRRVPGARRAAGGAQARAGAHRSGGRRSGAASLQALRPPKPVTP